MNQATDPKKNDAVKPEFKPAPIMNPSEKSTTQKADQSSDRTTPATAGKPSVEADKIHRT